ncbi:hypothetical protein WDU94_003152 [Cyamophila willieti]
MFQIPYYWPWQHRQSPDNVEYAIYLEKRSLRNKQRHGLEDYELESLNNLKRNLANKWDLISMQAEEQVRLSKDRKKVDKIVADSQERAYWRVHRPPPGFTSSLEPIPTCMRGGTGHRKKRSVEDLKKELDFLKSCLDKTRTKTSLVVESLVLFSETYSEYDAFFTTPNPSNPWHNDDTQHWLLNSPLVEVPTERRVRRWALSIEDLIKDPTGLAEFTTYLRKEYSHENIRFWLMVNELRRSSQSKIANKVKDIFDEFLAAGAPCEINIDGRTMERTQTELKTPSRFTYDAAAEHVYTLLLKNDCYPRFIRSDHYKTLLQAGKQPCKEITTRALRRGSDRSLTDGAHELAVNTRQVAHSHSQSNLSDINYPRLVSIAQFHELAVNTRQVAHSHSQSNLSDINYPRDTTIIHGGSSTEETNQDDVCPWDDPPSHPPPSRPASIVHQPSGPQLVTATSLVGPHAYSLDFLGDLGFDMGDFGGGGEGVRDAVEDNPRATLGNSAVCTILYCIGIVFVTRHYYNENHRPPDDYRYSPYYDYNHQTHRPHRPRRKKKRKPRTTASTHVTLNSHLITLSPGSIDKDLQHKKRTFILNTLARTPEATLLRPNETIHIRSDVENTTLVHPNETIHIRSDVENTTLVHPNETIHIKSGSRNTTWVEFVNASIENIKANRNNASLRTEYWFDARSINWTNDNVTRREYFAEHPVISPNVTELRIPIS